MDVPNLILWAVALIVSIILTLWGGENSILAQNSEPEDRSWIDIDPIWTRYQNQQ